MAVSRKDDRERDRDGQLSSELTPQDVDNLLSDLELKMERLKVLYEQYFLGVERAEPIIPRKDVVRTFHVLSRIQIRNTALRFRHQTLLQRWNLLQTRWGKTLREIEKGTYVRHVARAQRRGVELPDELKVAVGGATSAQEAQRAALEAAPGSEDVLFGLEESGIKPTPSLPAALCADEGEGDLSSLLREFDDGGWDALDRGAPTQPTAPQPRPTNPPRAAQALSPPLPHPDATTRPTQAMPPPFPRPPSPLDPAQRPTQAMPPPFSRPPAPLEPAQRPTQAMPPPLPRPPAPPLDPAQRPTQPMTRPLPAVRPPPPPSAAPPAPSVPGMSDSELRELHRRYSAAAGAPVRYEKLIATLEKQVPAILRQHGCNGVSFDVVVHNGKAVLKATPKR